MSGKIQNNEIVVRPNFFEEEGAPNETLQHLFCCLDEKRDVSSLGRTNRRLQQISSDDYVWKHLLIKYFPHSFAQNQLQIPELYLFKKLTAIQSNLTKGVYTISRLLLPFGPNTGDYQIHGNRIFHAPSAANSILIYDFTAQQPPPFDLINDTVQRTLIKQQSQLLDLTDQIPVPRNLTPEQHSFLYEKKLMDHRLAQQHLLIYQSLRNAITLCLTENTVNNFNTNLIIPQFQSSLKNEAGNLTTSFHVHGQQLYAGGIYNAEGNYFHETTNGPTNTHRITIWDLETLQPVNAFDIAGETYVAGVKINCLCVQKDELFVGIGDFVVIWDLKEERIKRKIPAGALVTALRVQENSLFIRTVGNTISRYDFKSENPVVAPIYTFGPTTTLLSFEIFENFHVLLRNNLSGIIEFHIRNAKDTSDITSYSNKSTLFGMPTPMTPVAFFQVCEGRFFAQHATDNGVYIFDFNDPSDQ